jgi:CBS domain-containing protein
MKELDIITERLNKLDQKINEKDKQKKYDFFKENILEVIKVEEILEKPEVVNIHTPVEKVMEIMSRNNSSEVLVSMNEEIVGMVTLSKLLEALRERKHIVQLEAGNIMDKVVKISKKDNLSKAILIMDIHKTPCVAVFDKDNLVGIVTKTGILNRLSKIIFTKKEGGGVEEIIETKVDQLIDILKKGKISMQKIKKNLNISEDQLEDWLNILEKQGIIKIEKSHFGKIKVKVKDVG